MQCGGQCGLAARGDEHLRRSDAAAHFTGEPGPQWSKPFEWQAFPRTGTASSAGEGGAEGLLGLEGRMQVAAVEGDHARRRYGEIGADARGVDDPGSRFALLSHGGERDLLPGRVDRAGAGAGMCAEGASARSGGHESFGATVAVLIPDSGLKYLSTDLWE